MNGVDAMCVGRFILFREKAEKVPASLDAHEMTHQRQMDQHGVFRFYLIYCLEYLAHRIRLGDHSRAYREIKFEKEAYGD